ncbi:hypothetical protein HYV49_04075 [Candidatus Pacearchaeota archaeon]|nr:hypothetical protein [Candidatus Pacearchaeota archaeon]
MAYERIKVVNIIIALFGLILILNAGRGITGFAISGENAYISLSIGGWIFFVSLLIYIVISYEEHKNFPRQPILRSISPLETAEDRFIMIYARKPTKPELREFIERDGVYGPVGGFAR